ncbi:ABC transporter ATP-binding protein [Herbivorax sp. ANBcel31]|uniref:ABC transporter ATP-binding protein n=1 Tax=Herbivorax sp. ANBcel31 TaxID=3069754 RepID=UPI0027B18C70|nr:ABC transporter ATP-binding protein [Herbivorax sp. ANBcel31]MDQ2085700.1 ABC transporter ATP-binding protein [Herbivorax sp. ANBcel31]
MPVNNFRKDENLKETVNIKVVMRLFSYLKPYIRTVIKVLILIGIVIFVELLNPYFMKVGIDTYISNSDVKGLLILGSIMAFANFAAMICAKYRILIMSGVSNKILLSLRQQLYNHIQKLSFNFFDNRSVGKILARIVGDVNALNELFTNSITNLIPDLIKMVVIAIIMFSMNYKLALVSFSTLPILFVLMFLVQIVSRKRWQIERKKTSNLNAYSHENFSGIKVVQGFNGEQKTRRTFRELLNDQRIAFVRAVRMNDMFWPLVELSWGGGTVLVFWYGLRLLNADEITIGVLVAFTSYISMFWVPVMNISNFYNILITNLAGAERIFEIMDIKPDIKDCENADLMPRIKGNVEFRNITFGYDKSQTVLQNVNFYINEGETVALVGPTGAGKTTIINLISRFYETSRGKVLIDGLDVTKVTLESLRSQLGIMLQDTFLFSGTVKDNIRYGKLDASNEEIIEAAKTVCAHDFIKKLPDGYDTDVNERGSRLSAGQRQLIAFARVLLANPRILILDEATASIDTYTEKSIQQGIQNLLEGRTSFVIAHRLSTIQNSDRIMVIDDKGIKEEGTHEELINKKGMYYELFISQFKFLDGREVM